MKTFSRGFTLFEILIVVVIIGILATVLVASIDPLESIRKSNDTALITTLTNIENAFATYAANEGVMPWDDTTKAACLQTASFPAGFNAITNAMTNAGGNLAIQITGGGAAEGCVGQLITKKYLKESVLGALNTSRRNRVFFSVIKDAANGDKALLCFRPESRDVKKKMNWGVGTGTGNTNLTTYLTGAAVGATNGPKDANEANGMWCAY
ncbi:MAG: prepilin-type N-terminal cleavage/methylation domain-containing protein [Candidatus Roizmanbacteria bacterium]